MYVCRSLRDADASIIAGYDDGTQVIMDGRGKTGIAKGSKSWFWQYRDETLRVFNIEDRAFAIEQLVGPGAYQHNFVLVSADDEYLFFVQGLSPEEGDRATAARLWKFDIRTGNVLATRDGLPVPHNVCRMDDGALLLERWSAEGSNLLRIDADSLDIATDALRFAQTAPPGSSRYATMIGWSSHSLNGQYWLRFDHTRMEVRDTRPEGVSGEGPYFGVSFQIWEAFPLRFRSSVPLFYHSIDKLPDLNTIVLSRMQLLQGRHDFKFSDETIARALDDTRAEREEIWRSIAAGLNSEITSPPDAPFPSRDRFGRRAVSDEAFWDLVLNGIRELARTWSHHAHWQDDQRAAWLKYYQKPDHAFVCLSMDGRASPMMFYDRDAGEPFQVEPRKDCTMFATLRNGELRLDGTPSKGGPHAVTVPVHPKLYGTDEPRFYEDSYYQRKVRQLRRSAAYRDAGFAIIRKDN